MPSPKPLDYGVAKVGPRTDMAPVERIHLNLGEFTANATASPTERVLFDRPAVIRGIWITGTAVPADADGTMVLNALVYDASEAASDTIVSAEDLETLITVANKAYEATLAAEGTENELTVAAGDTLRFTLVNNSAAIDTNATINVSVLYQVTEAVS